MNSEETIKEKAQRKKKEKAKLNKILKSVDENKRKLVDNLVDNIAFMSVELQDLQEIIKNNGSVERYKNGQNQYGYKQSSAVQVYNAMLKSFASSLKILLQTVDENADNDTDDLKEFMRKYK